MRPQIPRTDYRSGRRGSMRFRASSRLYPVRPAPLQTGAKTSWGYHSGHARHAFVA